jgi:hypothetical protein
MRPGSVAAALALAAALVRPAPARAQAIFDLPGVGAATIEAEDTGYEYTRLLRDAWDLRYAGSDDALSVLFGFTTMFEGEAAQGHGRVLAALMKERGDEAFAQALGRERREIRRAVVAAIAPPARADAWKDFRRTAAVPWEISSPEKPR